MVGLMTLGCAEGHQEPRGLCPHPCQKLVLLLTASVEWSTTGPYAINRQLVPERPYEESLMLMTTSQERKTESHTLRPP